MAMTLCFIFLSACKPKTILDTTPLKAEIAQEFAKADKGDAAARFNIGLMYFRGEGVPQDYRQARVWFEKAAMQGLGEAQYNMGAMLEQGLGTEKNAATARTWYEKAAAQGNAHAQYNLARLYLTGKGTSQNIGKAGEWMQKAFYSTVNPAHLNRQKSSHGLNNRSRPVGKKRKSCRKK